MLTLIPPSLSYVLSQAMDKDTAAGQGVRGASAPKLGTAE